MSDAVLNRYTSDSWSLELTGQSSALSRWTSRPVVKDEHFRLSLLGFETGAAPISWLEGDRPLLENLHQTVEAYVQQHLQTPSLMGSIGAGSVGTEAVDSNAAELTPDVPPLEPLPSTVSQISANGAIVVDNPFGQTAEGKKTQDSSSLAPVRQNFEQTFEIEKEGTMAHRLHYRPTATQPRSLKLTTVQLADLLEVLDRWQNESMALPPEASGTGSNVIPGSFASMPAWGRVAASAAIALGAAGGGLYLLMSQPAAQLASSEAEDVALESSEAAVEEGLSAFPQVSTNPSGTLPNAQVRSPEFSAPFLKQRDLDNPDGADLATDPSLPPSAILPGSEDDLPDSSTDEFLIAEGDTTLSSPEFSTVPLPDDGLSPDLSPDLGLPDASPDALVVPAVPTEPVPTPDTSVVADDRFLPGAGFNAATGPGLDVEAAIAQRQTSAAVSSGSNPASTGSTLSTPDPMSPVTPTGPTLETFPTITAPTSFNTAQEELADAEADLATSQPIAASSSAGAKVAGDAGLGEITLDPLQSEAAKLRQREQPADVLGDTSAEESAVGAPASPPKLAAPVAIAKPQASVEQVSELQSAAVKKYFESRWTPPADLKQSLQYQLILSGEGSIERMNPLSPAATDYADQAGIPDVGENFIEPSTGIQDSTVILTLGADGKVQVSVENVTPE